MLAMYRLALGVLVSAILVWGSGCGASAPVSSQKLDADAAAAAANIEKGERMKNGESREIHTAFGIVTVKKEADGKMTYLRKK